MSRLTRRLKKKTYYRFVEMFRDELYRYGIRDGMFHALQRIRERGFEPRTVIDVGAYTGSWTSRVMEIFPAASFFMFEAQPDKQAQLEQLQRQHPGKVEVLMGLLGSEPRDAVPYFLMETGSSVLEENTDYERKVVELPMYTLDSQLQGRSLDTPLLLKLDVQGFELEVLRGAGTTLAMADVVLLEVSVLEYNKGAPLLAEVIAFMDAAGFMVIDIPELKRTVDDQALFQCDMLFCRKDHTLSKVDRF